VGNEVTVTENDLHYLRSILGQMREVRKFMQAKAWVGVSAVKCWPTT
jgi:hypothetical protein